MIDRFALKFATVIKQANEEQTASVEVLQYALIIIINSSLIILESLTIGYFTNQLLGTAHCLTAFATLRLFSGGRHASSTMKCNVISTLICTSIPHIPLHSEFWLAVVNTVSLLIIIVYAPNHDSETRIDARFFVLFKIISIIMIGSNYYFHSSVLGLSFLVQAVTIIQIKGRRRIKYEKASG